MKLFLKWFCGYKNHCRGFTKLNKSDLFKIETNQLKMTYFLGEYEMSATIVSLWQNLDEKKVEDVIKYRFEKISQTYRVVHKNVPIFLWRYLLQI